jgi:hypothetical protein
MLFYIDIEDLDTELLPLMLEKHFTDPIYFTIFFHLLAIILSSTYYIVIIQRYYLSLHQQLLDNQQTFKYSKYHFQLIKYLL